MTRELNGAGRSDVTPGVSGEEWMAKAWCPRVTELPWTGEPDRVTFAAEVAMAAVCQACPVWLECAEYVTRQGITSGFWAGAHRDPRVMALRRAGIGAPSNGVGGAA
jgi:hypothetical protein